MIYMLDTNICIYAMNGNLSVLNKLNEVKDNSIISSIVYAELVFGIENSNCKGKNYRTLNGFLEPIGILPFDRSAAKRYGEIRFFLQHLGIPIGDHDIMIAAHALSLGLPLVTNNVREFERVPDLKIENWYE